jgi:hypothetical protein
VDFLDRLVELVAEKIPDTLRRRIELDPSAAHLAADHAAQAARRHRAANRSVNSPPAAAPRSNGDQQHKLTSPIVFRF